MAQETSKFIFTRDQAAAEGVHGPQDLPKLIGNALGLARPPISKFHVGVVGLTSNGRVFLGVNVEFKGVPLHHSIHAEQFLVTNLALNSDQEKLTHIAVSAGTDIGAPCGHCRQFYQELDNAPRIQILIKKKGIDKFMRLESLMPGSFGLGSLLKPRNNGLVLAGGEKICEHYCCHLKCKALTAANESYAPYSECPSGVALVCGGEGGGEVYRGWYIESVAYNPSVGPVQAALVDFVARGGGKEFSEIKEVVLVEMEGTKVSQEATARILLEKVAAKGFTLRVFHCNKTQEN